MQVIQIIPELSPLTGHNRQSVLIEQFIHNLNHRFAFCILPWYEKIKISEEKIKALYHFKEASIFETTLANAQQKVILIKPLNRYFTSSDFDDNIESVILFNKTCVEFIQNLEDKYIIHCHSALCGLVPLLLKANPVTESYPSLFTLHDLKKDYPIYYESLIRFHLDDYFMNEIKILGADSLIKIGILFSKMINLCSKQYAIEVQDEEVSDTYAQFFKQRAHDLFGIMNGVQYGIWNPAIDPQIPCKYDSENHYARFYNKILLQEKLNFPDREEVPIFFFGTRLTEEKGFDLILEVLDTINDKDMQLLIYGTGEDFLEIDTNEKIRSLENVRIIKEFDTDFIHLILSACDFILLPSHTETDGVSFLYALKYGLIPIANKTGGLVDAVIDQTSEDNHLVNGFFLPSNDSNSLISVIQEAIEVYKDKHLLSRYIKNAMNADWSWKTSIKQYENLYLKLEQNNHH